MIECGPVRSCSSWAADVVAWPGAGRRYTWGMPDLANIQVRRLPAAGYRHMRWKNGAGWTREIARSCAGEGWRWRLSIAQIEHESAFSTFPGVERELLLLSGGGLYLHFGDGASHLLSSPYASLRFAGERVVIGAPVGGPVTVFNLMWRRPQTTMTLWRWPLSAALPATVEHGQVWALHLLTGWAYLRPRVGCVSVGVDTLSVGDTWLLEKVADMELDRRLEGVGDALLIRFAPSAGNLRSNDRR